MRSQKLDTEILPILTRKGQTSLTLFSLSAFQGILEDAPDGALNLYSLMGDAELLAISFAAKPEALQPNVARQAHRFFFALARVAQNRLADPFLAEEMYGRVADAVVASFGVEDRDWNTARAEYDNAGRQAVASVPPSGM